MSAVSPPVLVPGGRVLQRLAVGTSGGALVLLGLVLVPLPGPGWLIVAAGSGLLGTEFPWAAAVSRRLRTALSAAVAVSDRLPAGRVLLVLAVVASTVLPLLLL